MRTYGKLILLYVTLTWSTVYGCPSTCNCPPWSGTVNCQGGSITDVISQLPANTNSLQVTGVTDNGLTQSTFDTVNTPSLSQFTLRQSYVPTVGENTFSKLSGLRRLNLTGNAIKTIDKNAFKGLKSLERLDLSSNEIQVIKEIFLPLGNLRELYLQTNKIGAIDAGSFSAQAYLSKLVLDQNEIQSFSGSGFQGLHSLHFLSMRKCELTSIPTELLGALHKVTELNLGDNNIFSLPSSEDWRRHAPLLSMLHLDHNDITALQPRQFQDMTLGRLDLSANRLTRIVHNNFYGSNIAYLDLSLNSITQVDGRSFMSLGPRLKTLKLAYNSIMKLPSDAFSGLYSLQTLNLSNCALTELKENQFYNLNQLHYLDMSNNNLQNIPTKVFNSFRYMSRLYLANNKWNCDCDILPFRDWLASIGNQFILACSNDQTPQDFYKCQHPKCFSPQNLYMREIQQLSNSQIESCTTAVDENSLSAGAIAGIAIACVIFCIIMGIVIFVCWYRRQGKPGFIPCKGAESVVSSHKEDFDKDEKPNIKPFTDDAVSLQSDKSFVVRHYFQTMVSTDPSVTTEHGDRMRRDTFRSNFSGSNTSLASCSSYSYPMGRETAI